MINFFNKIIDTLESCNIPYMLSGSIAMGLYTLPRATRDFDFIVHLKLNNIEEFVTHFKEGFYCNQDAVMDAVKQESLFNIIDYESGYKADFVILKKSSFRLEEFGRKNKVEYFGRTVNVVTAEDLTISKLIWIQDIQSPLQMDDITKLLEINNLDRTYIKNWCLTLNLNTFGLLL